MKKIMVIFLAMLVVLPCIISAQEAVEETVFLGADTDYVAEAPIRFKDVKKCIRNTSNNVKRTFSCPVAGCKRYFKSQNNLDDHIFITHTREKIALHKTLVKPLPHLWLCDVEDCKESFGFRENLAYHKKEFHSWLNYLDEDRLTDLGKRAS